MIYLLIRFVVFVLRHIGPGLARVAWYASWIVLALWWIPGPGRVMRTFGHDGIEGAAIWLAGCVVLAVLLPRVRALLAWSAAGWWELGRRLRARRRPVVGHEPVESSRRHSSHDVQSGAPESSNQWDVDRDPHDQRSLSGQDHSTPQLFHTLWSTEDPTLQAVAERLAQLDNALFYVANHDARYPRCVWAPDGSGGWICSTHGQEPPCPYDVAHLLGYQPEEPASDLEP